MVVVVKFNDFNEKPSFSTKFSLIKGTFRVIAGEKKFPTQVAACNDSEQWTGTKFPGIRNTFSPALHDILGRFRVSSSSPSRVLGLLG